MSTNTLPPSTDPAESLEAAVESSDIAALREHIRTECRSPIGTCKHCGLRTAPVFLTEENVCKRCAHSGRQPEPVFTPLDFEFVA